MPPGRLPTFPSGADDDAFNGLSWAPPNIMFCWAAGCWPPPTMTTMPATMVARARAGLRAVGWDQRSRRVGRAPSRRLPFACKSHRHSAGGCPSRGARRHSAPLGTKRLQKPATPYPAPDLNGKARGTVRPLAEPCEDVSGPESTPSKRREGSTPTPRDGIAAPPGARFQRSPRGALRASRSGRRAHRSVTLVYQ